MADITHLKDRWKQRMKQGVGQRILIWLGLIGMALILLSQLLGSSHETTAPPSEDVAAYAATLEHQLTTLIEEIDGVGECRVMVTLENGMEYRYTQPTVLVTQILPTVKGVVVVCDGADDPTVEENVIAVVTTALHLTQKRVCVTKSA